MSHNIKWFHGWIIKIIFHMGFQQVPFFIIYSEWLWCHICDFFSSSEISVPHLHSVHATKWNFFWKPITPIKAGAPQNGQSFNSVILTSKILPQSPRFYWAALVNDITGTCCHEPLALQGRDCECFSSSRFSIAGTGFEPATSWLWAMRATRLLYPAIVHSKIRKY